MSHKRLLLDVMCGDLRSYLRMCGHDTVYALDRGIEDDDRIRSIARTERRTLITRDRQLAESVSDAIILTATETTEQLRTLRAVGIELTLSEPQRCGRCNGPLERTHSPRADSIPDDNPVWQCSDCGQFFWKGSHWEHVRATLDSL
ncbi:Mut7-C RNAse domain-containing protein [Halocatena halophila]|uniref:Mut7-C RNAse domain-containing protein n=1 Tax=Halocatena halophila TaxID=2814576 RepID=UPI002ECFBC5B